MRKISTLFLTITLVLVATCVYAVDFRRAKNFEDAFNASCRVSVSNARGTGTFIGVDNESGNALILTNYHVVTNNTRATLDFWTNGEKQSVSGQVIARFYDAKKPADFALIAVNANELKRIDPPFVALAGKDGTPDANSYILSAGAPKGRFVQAWKGKVLGYYNGATLLFQPAPVPGQSGSGVISDIDGELWLTAVLTWLIGAEGSDDSRGGAIPIANLYACLNGRNTNFNDDNFSPIPPDAVECSAPYIVVEEFTADNCPPCVEAEKDVKVLRKKGYKVNQIRADIGNGAEIAARKKVDRTPTFIVYINNKEFKRYLGANKSAAIIADIEKETAKEETETPPAPKVADEKPLVSPFDNLATALSSNLFDVAPPAPIFPPDKEVKPELQEDFRERPAVYDYIQAGFFDDSNRRWQDRNGGAKEQEPETPKQEPQTPAPSIDENALGDRLGNRIGGKLADGLSGALNSQIEGICDSIEGRVNAKIEEIKKDIKREFLKLRVKLFVFLFFMFVFGVWVADFVKAVFFGGVKKIKAFILHVIQNVAENTADFAGRVANSAKQKDTETAKE